MELALYFLQRDREHGIHQDFWSERKLHSVVICFLLHELNVDTGDMQHAVRPIIEIILGLCGTVRRHAFLDERSGIGDVILCGREAVPRFVHRETDLLRGAEQLGKILHHALQTGW